MGSASIEVPGVQSTKCRDPSSLIKTEQDKMLFLHNIVPKNSLRWKFYANHGIIHRDRRNEIVFTTLHALVDDVLPVVRLNSCPAKDQVERHLVEVVDAATRFVSETPAMMDPMDSMAGLGLTGVHNEDFNLLEEEVSFLERAREATGPGQELTNHVFQAFHLFLAIIEAGKRFLEFAAENVRIRTWSAISDSEIGSDSHQDVPVVRHGSPM